VRPIVFSTNIAAAIGDEAWEQDRPVRLSHLDPALDRVLQVEV
jgi:hypothetical protein